MLNQIVAAYSKPSTYEVAVVEDDPSVRRAVGRILTVAGYKVVLFQSAEEFLAQASHQDCVVLDVQLPGLSGLELEQRLRAADARTPVVFFTGCTDAKRALIARQTGRLCVHKPADDRVLLEAVAHAIHRQL